ncbi:hypothetical protein [Rosenbergiella collisarenosi]|uniref:hypothetical protein n=1 Tax=Rosenbergiella collisarenosi TaxID=1544695 RepID=UPI001F4D5A70|nr:hypothetical protein [Rosenbergiella collisarenosi]
MDMTKRPILDPNNKGIVGFDINISTYFFNENKARDQCQKISNKIFDVNYSIDEFQKNDHDSPRYTEELEILKETLTALISERDKIEKELEDSFDAHYDADQNYGDFNQYSHFERESQSLSYATTLVTDASFIDHKPDEFNDSPPTLSIELASHRASIALAFSSTASAVDSDDIVLKIYTEHSLYGECKDYGVSVSGDSADSFSYFTKFCEWVRTDGEEDKVDDDLGYWGSDQTFSDGSSCFSVGACSIRPGSISLHVRCTTLINIKELFCTITFNDDGNSSARVKIINGNPLIEKRETLGFTIVKSDAPLHQLESEIFTTESPFKAIELFRKLNGPSDKHIKAGNILLLADPDSPYEKEISQLISAQKTAQLTLEVVDKEGVNSDFFLNNYATLSNFLSIGSQGVGIAGTAGEVYFSRINNILNQIDQLYKSTYVGNAALGGEAYYLRRGALFSELDTLLKKSFLRQVLNLPQDVKIKSALRLSSKSIVHHWKTSGITDIPGYATHLKKAGKLIGIMKTAGYVGIAFSAINSANEIYHACSIGRENECKRAKFREIGKFTGGMAGGIAGAAKGASLCVAMTLTGPWSSMGCFLGLSIIGAEVGAYFGESTGDILYSVIENQDESK